MMSTVYYGWQCQVTGVTTGVVIKYLMSKKSQHKLINLQSSKKTILSNLKPWIWQFLGEFQDPIGLPEIKSCMLYATLGKKNAS